VAPFQPSATPTILTVLPQATATPPLGPTNTLLIPTLTGPVATQPPPPTVETIFQPTQPPAPATETQQALELTATFLIQSAQNTLAAAATGTATALGTGLPPGVVLTATPTLPRGTVRITGTPQGTPGAPGSGAAGTITGDCIYTVVSGDRMFRIALRFNTTPADIARANGIININLINPGQQLRIPNCNVTPPPAVTPTPTFGQGGPTTSVPPIVTATRSAGSGQVYTVQRGDTLFSISLRYRVTVAAMAQANNIANPALIYPGQKLTIP
jgi:LysM repeat protein